MNLNEIFSASLSKDFLLLNSIYITFIVAVVEAIKSAKLFSRQYLPLIAIILGALLGFGTAVTQNASVLNGVINGTISGAVATGIYSAVKEPLGKSSKK